MREPDRVSRKVIVEESARRHGDDRERRGKIDFVSYGKVAHQVRRTTRGYVAPQQRGGAAADSDTIVVDRHVLDDGAGHGVLGAAGSGQLDPVGEPLIVPLRTATAVSALRSAIPYKPTVAPGPVIENPLRSIVTLPTEISIAVGYCGKQRRD
jgi:hypothetical protein